MGTKRRVIITPTSIEVVDADGHVRMRMGTIGDEPVARARLYVHGVPGIYVNVTSTENWEDVRKLRNAWGEGRTIYMWVDTKGEGLQWRMAMDHNWKYATPPKEIALAHYLLEGE